MPDDTFIHDLDHFEPEDAFGGIDIADAETKYAELFADAMADGEIFPEERERLDMASAMLGLDEARVAKIEASQVAGLADEMTSAPEDEEDERTADSIAPLAPADDPAARALQARIAALEQQNDAITRDNFRLSEQVDAFSNLVEQLQFALETTMDDLDVVRRQLAHEREDSQAPPPTESLTQRRLDSEPMLAPKLPETMTGPPEPPEQLVAAKIRHNPTDLHRKLRRHPRDASLLRALNASLGRAADVDRRWCIAHALVFLGEADNQQTELFERHRNEGMVRPRRAINDDEWRELLFHPAEDQLTGEILAAIAPAVLLGQITAIRASISPELLDPDTRVEPKTSTLQAVRCVTWAAAFLGLRVPPLHVCPDEMAMMDLVLNPTPCTRLGKQALSGRSSKELAFVAGRHLSWYRREHLLGRPLRSIRRLEDAFLAALMIGNPGLPLGDDIKKRVAPIAQIIRPLLDSDSVETLQHCFARFVEFGGRTNLTQWLRGAERTSDCTGLLLCDDLWAAHAMLSLEDEAHAEVSIDDLICFLTAERCTMLRRRIGIAVGSDK